MNRLPSTSVKYGPSPLLKKMGAPPTARKARTGEFTPPGMSCRALANSSWLRDWRTDPSSVAGFPRARRQDFRCLQIAPRGGGNLVGSRTRPAIESGNVISNARGRAFLYAPASTCDRRLYQLRIRMPLQRLNPAINRWLVLSQVSVELP